MYDYANDEYDYVSKDDHDNSGFGKWDRSGKAFHLTDDDDDEEEEEDMDDDDISGFGMWDRSGLADQPPNR